MCFDRRLRCSSWINFRQIWLYSIIVIGFMICILKSFNSFLIQAASWHTSVRAINSDSVNARATQFCFLQHQLTSLPLMKKYSQSLKLYFRYLKHIHKKFYLDNLFYSMISCTLKYFLSKGYILLPSFQSSMLGWKTFLDSIDTLADVFGRELIAM